MSCYKRYSITKYITGGCWIITGILGNFDGIVTDVIRITFLVLLVSVLMYQIRIMPDKTKQETSSADEAKKFAHTTLCYAFCTVAVLIFVVSLLFDEKDSNWMFRIMRILSITLGLIDIRTGVSLCT